MSHRNFRSIFPLRRTKYRCRLLKTNLDNEANVIIWLRLSAWEVPPSLPVKTDEAKIRTDIYFQFLIFKHKFPGCDIFQNEKVQCPVVGWSCSMMHSNRNTFGGEIGSVSNEHGTIYLSNQSMKMHKHWSILSSLLLSAVFLIVIYLV